MTFTRALAIFSIVLAASVAASAQRGQGGPPPGPPPPLQGPGRGSPGRGGPDGLAAVVVPANNPMTPEKVAAGRKLFFDTSLSADRTTSCATCHDPAKSFTDGRTVARGVHNIDGTRNTPSLINVGSGRSFFWDGRAATLEAQVLGPLTNPKEMGLTEADVEQRTGMKAVDVSNAIASYMRTIRSTDSPYDWFRAGHTEMLNADQRAGLEVFRTRGCVTCHGGPNLTDDRFHNTGVGWHGPETSDVGRFAITGENRDRGAFKTPTLRDVARTAPYMHDGSIATLEDVVEFYSRGGRLRSLAAEVR